MSRRVYRIRVFKAKIWLWRRLLDVYIGRRKNLRVSRLSIFIDRFLRFFDFFYCRGFYRVFNLCFSKFVRRLVNSRLAVVNIFRPSNDMFAVNGNVKIFINIARFLGIFVIFGLVYMFLDNLSDGLVKFKFFECVFFLSLNIGG